MLVSSLLVVVLLSVLLGPGRAWAADASAQASPEGESAEARDARMAWWRDARFGMFVHWGLYSGLAGAWKGESTGDRGGKEWIQQGVKVDTWEYAHEAAPLFRPREGFAQDWARLAREAGCRYVVFTSKHHEGFALFDSSATDYDGKDWTGRDLCREIVDAVRAENLKVGFYHSVIDWHHPQYDYEAAKELPHPLRGKPSPNGPRNHAVYVDYLHHQVRELLSNYGGIDVIWWDFSKEGNDGPFWRSDELMTMVRGLQPKIISNDRLYHVPDIEAHDSVGRLAAWKPTRGDFTTPEQTIPSQGVPGVDWEVCMTMNTTWGYSDFDDAWKTPETLLRNLVDIVSKGGNYLLNIGPKGDGSIPQESVAAMRAIGAWMAVNGEAIYGTQASPCAAPEWGRFTRKAGKLYAHIFDWPKDGVLILPDLTGVPKRAYLLADAARSALSVEGTATGFRVQLPAKAPDAIASVLVLEGE